MGLSTPENSLITIVCTAFNHADTIKLSLDSFLSQECPYPYCIVVHDDCSTDGTAGIIKEYADKYPGMVIPILQDKNQYSQGVSIIRTFIVPLIKTKYVALCEGDDYWCDDSKLRIQTDWMEAHDECALCVHNTERINFEGTSLGTFLNNAGRDYDISVGTIIKDFGDNLFQTSSMLNRAEYYLNRPAEFKMGQVSDFPTVLYMALNGSVHYIDRVMSRYRTQNLASWTGRTMNDIEKSRAHTQDAVEFFAYLDSYTGGRFHEDIEYRVSNYWYNFRLQSGDISEIMKNPVHRKKYLKTVVLAKIKRAIKRLIVRN